MAIAELLRSETDKKNLFAISLATEASSKHPDHNEDALLANPNKGYLAVFDGVGGAVHGEEASNAARNAFDQVLRQLPENPTQQAVEDLLHKGYREAVNAIAEKEKKFSHKGMATTATVVCVYEQDGEQYVTWLQVGDSRAYLVEEANMKQLTEDDSYVNGILRLHVHDGTISQQEADAIKEKLNMAKRQEELPKEWRWLWNMRNRITKDIDATEKSKPKIVTKRLKDLSSKAIGILVVSDGVSDNAPDNQIHKALQQGSFTDKAKNVVQMAHDIAEQRGEGKVFSGRAKPDDISAGFLQFITPKG